MDQKDWVGPSDYCSFRGQATYTPMKPPMSRLSTDAERAFLVSVYERQVGMGRRIDYAAALRELHAVVATGALPPCKPSVSRPRCFGCCKEAWERLKDTQSGWSWRDGVAYCPKCRGLGLGPPLMPLWYAAILNRMKATTNPVVLRVLERRLELRMSDAKLARLSGVGTKRIRKLEQGGDWPEIHDQLLTALAGALNVTVEWLRCG